MSTTGAPAPRCVQSKLGEITERLASELDAPTSAAPRWSDLEWRLAQAAAAMHGVSPLLRTGLRWRGPAPWEDFLTEQRAHTLHRQQRIAALVARIDELARREGSSMMMLKGAALHALGVYAPGERPMADLDLLVPPAGLDAATRVLSILGYRDAGVTWKHASFEPCCGGAPAVLGEHADNAVKIDVHSRIAERLPLAPLDFSDLIAPAEWPAGVGGYPSRAALMLHVLAHAAGTMVTRGLRLIHLIDVARLARDMTSADWSRLIGFDGATRRLWWAYSPLAMAAKYFPSDIPVPVLDRLARETPWLLRRATNLRTLADISYAHVFVDALPGLVWARSPRETVRYVAARLRPSGEQLAQFEVLARMGPWSAAPEWYTQSQSRRIWRWLTSKPTRIEAMRPVKAALER